MWDTTVLIFVSDNGGPLDHCTNEPLRGGKHTFFEGGVRVMSFISGPMIPADRRGTRWAGMAASADWYATIPVGIAGGPPLPADTGYRPPDALNLWSSILDGSAGKSKSWNPLSYPAESALADTGGLLCPPPPPRPCPRASTLGGAQRHPSVGFSARQPAALGFC